MIIRIAKKNLETKTLPQTQWLRQWNIKMQIKTLIYASFMIIDRL